jgi:hypothetical protein
MKFRVKLFGKRLRKRLVWALARWVAVASSRGWRAYAYGSLGQSSMKEICGHVSFLPARYPAARRNVTKP